MQDNGTEHAVTTLLGTDLTVADHHELATASGAVARLQSFVDLAKVQISRRSRQLADQGDSSADGVLTGEGRMSGKDAKNTDERDRVCGELPEFEDALADGRCTAGHLDAIAQHTKDLTDAERSDLASVVDDLLGNAESEPIGVFDKTTKGIIDRIRKMHRPDTADEELERQRGASRVKRWTDRDTGMKHTLISLDSIRDATLWNAFNHHLRQLQQDPANKGRPFNELQVEAVIAATSAGEPSERVPEIIVVSDPATMCHGQHDSTLCETIDGEPLPAGAVQRMCCEAILTAVIVNPDGTVDRICEERRTANRRQRRMLAAMYATCAHPHCEVGFSQCRVHHIEWFSRGGKTILSNLIPLCERHHHLVHEGGWNLTIDTNRRLSWHQPDGTVWHTDRGPNRVPDHRETSEPEGSGPRSRPADPPRRPPKTPPRQPSQPPPAASGQKQRPITHRPRRTSRRTEPVEPPARF